MLHVSATHVPLLQVYGAYKPLFGLPYNKTSNKGQHSVVKLLQMIDGYCRNHESSSGLPATQLASIVRLTGMTSCSHHGASVCYGYDWMISIKDASLVMQTCCHNRLWNIIIPHASLRVRFIAFALGLKNPIHPSWVWYNYYILLQAEDDPKCGDFFSGDSVQMKPVPFIGKGAVSHHTGHWFKGQGHISA